MAAETEQDKEEIKEKEEDIEYVASCVGDKENSMDNNEKILFGETRLEDRRKKVISSDDKRSIIKCIGRIVTKYNEQSSRYYVGTGTVFHYDDKTKNVFVITCAHNVVTMDEKNHKKPVSVVFQRRSTFHGDEAPITDAEYDCNINQIKYDQEYKFRGGCSNDLAMLIFVDDGFYKEIFENVKDDNHKPIIKLFPSNDIPSQFLMKYSIYGYPCNGDDNSKVSKSRKGEMWGMEARSYDKILIDKKYITMYVRQNEENTMFYYNAIDSEGGQSGSAIFIVLNYGKYGIVGIHTGGNKRKEENFGVALNDDKLEWIQSVIAGQ